MAKLTIFVISDSLGETAESVAMAASSQFKEEFNLVKVPKMATKNGIEKVILEAKNKRSVIFFTLVQKELHDYLEEKAQEHNILYFDILGPAISMLEEVTEEAPYLEPGRWRLVDSNYYRRIEALEFAVKHDDSRSVHDIKKADLVLIGISRTSKTPLSIYLALRGLRVANVPLVLGLEPPREIFDISHKKMIGLTIEAQALAEIRSRRIEVLQGKNNGYMKMSSILNEIEQAEATMRKIGCRIINVTHKAVEEIASEILRYKSNP